MVLGTSELFGSIGTGLVLPVERRVTRSLGDGSVSFFLAFFAPFFSTSVFESDFGTDCFVEGFWDGLA